MEGGSSSPGGSSLLFDAEGELAALSRLVARSRLPSTTVPRFEASIQVLLGKAANPRLALGVVGAFSCGKSTFVNALLGRQILPSSALACTAVPTRLIYGEEPRVTVRIADTGRGRPMRECSDPKEIAALAGRMSEPGSARDGLPALIACLTTQKTVASRITAITIEYPASFLANDLVVIDTPGINADVEGHEEATARVLQEESDAAVVLLPAKQALPATTRAFLAAHVGDCLERSVFVVTRIDEVPAAERDAVLKDIRSRIVRDLGVPDPQVLACAAGPVVAAELAGRYSADELESWSRGFRAVTLELEGRLLRERWLTVSEKLIRLIGEIMHDLKLELEGERKRCRESIAALEEARIRDLASFAAEVSGEAGCSLGRALAGELSRVAEYFEAAEKHVLEEAHAAIFATKDDRDVHTLFDGCAGLLTRAQQRLNRQVRQSAQRVQEALEDATRLLDHRFGEEYKKLRRLRRVERDHHSAIELSILASGEASLGSSAMSLSAEFDTKVAGRALGLASAAATVGAVLLGPLGLVGGGILGLVASLWTFDPQKKRRLLWEGTPKHGGLRSELSSRVRSMRKETLATFALLCDSTREQLESRVGANVGRYEAEVEARMCDQDRQRDDLRRTGREIGAALRELRDQRAHLERSSERIRKDRTSVKTRA